MDRFINAKYILQKQLRKVGGGFLDRLINTKYNTKTAQKSRMWLIYSFLGAVVVVDTSVVTPRIMAGSAYANFRSFIFSNTIKYFLIPK